MPDLLILISTLGGIAMFGIAGIIIGPVIAALFSTMWDLYYLTFQKLLDKGLVEGEAHVETKERAG
jgi:predicted PurR-regulated permease PerM